MRTIALLGARNGHTAIHPFGEHPIPLHAFPLWLYEFDDGVFVVDAERSDLVGTELVAIEGADVDEVLAAVTPLIAYDNEWTIRAAPDVRRQRVSPPRAWPSRGPSAGNVPLARSQRLRRGRRARRDGDGRPPFALCRRPRT